MKKNIFQIALIALTAGALALSCAQKEQPQDSKIQTPVLASISADEYFTNGSANVKATLSAETDHTVTVNLTVGSALSKDYTTAIDSDFITLGTITIPAGSKEGTATVTVDDSSFEKGKYETEVLIAGITGANTSSTKSSANILLLTGVSSVSVAYDDDFDEYGTTTFTVSMDMYSEKDCVVEIAQYAFNGYTNIPASAFTIESPITIKAGETEATGSVSIDLDKLSASASYAAGIQVASVSEGSFEIAAKASSGVLFSYTQPESKSDEWSLVYYGHIQNAKGETMEAFIVSGVNGYFDYFITAPDQEETNSFIFPEIFVDEEDYLAYYMSGGYTLDDLCYTDDNENGYAVVGAKKRAPGDYKLWIVAIDEDGNCTGEYATKVFTVEEEPEPTEAYAAWLGDWIVGSSAEDDKPIVITISQKDVNKSYFIDGLEGVDTVLYEISVSADFEEDGSISIASQQTGSWTHNTYGPAEDWLLGRIVIGSKVYRVGGEYPLTNITLNADGTATMSAESYWDEEEDGTLTAYAIYDIKYYWVVSAGAASYSNGSTPLPNTLIPLNHSSESAKWDDGIKKMNVPVTLHGLKHAHPQISGPFTTEGLLTY